MLVLTFSLFVFLGGRLELVRHKKKVIMKVSEEVLKEK